MDITELLASIPDEVTLDIRDPALAARLTPWDIEAKRLPGIMPLIEGLDTSTSPLYTFRKDRCYLWEGYTYENGKGKNPGSVTGGIKHTVLVPRLMYMMYKGIPLDTQKPKDPCACGAIAKMTKLPKAYINCCRLQVRHLCKDIMGEDHDGRCANPLHLTLGTPEDNNKDKMRHGNHTGQRGSKSSAATSTEEEVLAFYVDYKQNEETEMLRTIAERHQISMSKACDIICGESWNHVTGLPKAKKGRFEAKKAERRPMMKAFWMDYCHNKHTESLTNIVARYPGLSYTVASQMINQVSWNDVTGLPKRKGNVFGINEERQAKVQKVVADILENGNRLSFREYSERHGMSIHTIWNIYYKKSWPEITRVLPDLPTGKKRKTMSS